MERQIELSNPPYPFAHPLTRAQRETVLRIARRYSLPYRILRRAVQPGVPGSFAEWAAVTINGMYIGIEPDGYSHT